MKDKVKSLRRKYECFRKGKEDPLTVRGEAMILLKEARNNGDHKAMNEIEDMLIDLEFSIEENKCKCHRECSNC